MKKMRIILFFSGTILLIVCGCKNENNQAEYFPNKTGNNWQYRVFDSISNKSESLIVSIIGNKIINGVNSSVWLLSYTNQTDTFFVHQSRDTLIFNSNRTAKRIYIIPFSVNLVWKESYFSSSNSKVISIEDVKVDVGSFNGTYVIERSIKGNNYSLYEKIYFKPNVGIIKLYTKEYNLGPVQTKTWKLIRFNL